MILEWDALFEFNQTMLTKYKQSLDFIFVIFSGGSPFFFSLKAAVIVFHDTSEQEFRLCFAALVSSVAVALIQSIFQSDSSKSFLKFKNVCYLNLMI